MSQTIGERDLVERDARYWQKRQLVAGFHAAFLNNVFGPTGPTPYNPDPEVIRHNFILATAMERLGEAPVLTDEARAAALRIMETLVVPVAEETETSVSSVDPYQAVMETRGLGMGEACELVEDE